ncbi:MAG: site-specific integrase [Novosphingobium sp.]|nr:site-specific integrase [Novosphingobium sp.]
MTRRTAAEFHYISNAKTNVYLQKELDKGHISKSDKDILLKFLSYKISFDDIGESRYKKIATHLVHWRRWIPEFTECTMDDVILGVQKLKTGKNQKDEDYSANAIRDYISILKMFLTWLKKKGYNDIDVSELSDIRLPRKQNKRKIVTFGEGDIDKLILACTRQRDKAMISLLYEGGFRIGEIGTMVWDQIQIDNYGIILRENFKTGKMRTLRLVECKQDVLLWMNEYKATIGEPVGDAPVFLNKQNEPHRYAGLKKHIRYLANKAGVTIQFTPHSFRHTRVTDLRRQKVPDTVIGLMIWGDPNAEELKTYTHMGFEDVNSTMLEYYNIISPESRPAEPRMPRQCPECYEINPSRAEFCNVCGEPLTKHAREKLDRRIEKIKNKPEYNEVSDILMGEAQK